MNDIGRATSSEYRGRLRMVLLVVATVVAAAGCASGDSAQTDAPPAPTVPTLAPPAADPVETPCLSANPGFSARGTVSILGGSSPDAGQLSGLDWLLTPGCERIVFSFLTDESAPASAIGLTRLEFFPEQAIVRVSMPRAVTVSGIADALVDGALVARAFVVRARNGDLAVDLHMRGNAAIEARGLLIGSPARLVVDVRHGPDDDAFVSARPTIGPDVVVLSPTAGTSEYPLRIRGYARTLGDVVTAQVAALGDVVERRITAAPSTDAWGEFAVTISEGPAGNLRLGVRTDRPGDDPGAVVELTVP